MQPPYEADAQRAFADDLIDAGDRDMGLWSYEETKRYFLAGGGGEDAFEPAWRNAVGERKREAAAVRAGAYTTAGGSITYVVAGRKRVF